MSSTAEYISNPSSYLKEKQSTLIKDFKIYSDAWRKLYNTGGVLPDEKSGMQYTKNDLRKLQTQFVSEIMKTFNDFKRLMKQKKRRGPSRKGENNAAPLRLTDNMVQFIREANLGVDENGRRVQESLPLLCEKGYAAQTLLTTLFTLYARINLQHPKKIDKNGIEIDDRQCFLVNQQMMDFFGSDYDKECRGGASDSTLEYLLKLPGKVKNSDKLNSEAMKIHKRPYDQLTTQEKKNLGIEPVLYRVKVSDGVISRGTFQIISSLCKTPMVQEEKDDVRQKFGAQMREESEKVKTYNRMTALAQAAAV